MSYAAMVVALLVAFILFKIVKGMIKLFLLMLLLAAGLYYFNTDHPFPAMKEESTNI